MKLKLLCIALFGIVSLASAGCVEGKIKYLWLFPSDGKIMFQVEPSAGGALVTVNITKSRLADKDYFNQYQAMLQQAQTNQSVTLPCYSDSDFELVNFRIDRN